MTSHAWHKPILLHSSDGVPADPRRVVLVGPAYPYRGGIAHYNTLLAQAMSRDCTIKVLSFKRQYPAWLYPGATDRDPSQQLLEFPAEYELDPLYPWTWQSAFRSIYQFQPNLVIIHWWTTFWSPAFAFLARSVKLSGLQSVFLIHNTLPHEIRPWDRPLARLALQQANGYIVQTETEVNRLVEIIPQADPIILPHPIYDMFSGHSVPQEQARRQLGLPIDKSVILFFGIVRPYKGLADLVEAVACLVRQGRPLTLVIAGEFWEPLEQYQAQIKRLGIEDIVTVEPQYIPNETVGLFFSAADCFAAPYRSATQSGSVRMAMGFGLPIVVSEAIAADPSVANYPAVWKVPSGDPAALARGLDASLSSSIKRVEKVSVKAGDPWSDLAHAILERFDNLPRRTNENG